MNILNIILIFIIIILMIILNYSSKKRNVINNDIKEKNNLIFEENKKLIENNYVLENTNKNLKNSNIELLQEQKYTKKSIEDEKNRLKEMQEQIENSLNKQQEISKKAFENYCLILEEKYSDAEDEYKDLMETLEDAYSNKQLSLIDEYNKKKVEAERELEEIKEELSKLKDTRTAAIQATLRELEIEEKQEFYSLQISEEDKKESAAILSISHLFRDVRPLKMMIWSNYYLKASNKLCSNILGSSVVTGIYKITNKQNGLCYIGQAKDVKERIREHMKHGLGIDTPAANKLYIAMQKEGITSFTFELLEECLPAQLNEKEKFYIDLYDSYNHGYNNNSGIGENKYKK